MRRNLGGLDNGMWFTEVSHTAHVNTALQIVRDGAVRSRLVYDESRLRDHRLPVVWLSPNSWQYVGSRYGSVEFWFDWLALIEGKHSYWVEAVERYRPPAPRILLSSREAFAFEAERYDPDDRDGPWATNKDGDHFRNERVTLEFLHEEELSLELVCRISFVKHSDRYCSMFPTNQHACSELNLRDDVARQMFVSGLLVDKLQSINRLFVADGCANHHLREFLKYAITTSRIHAVNFRAEVGDQNPGADVALDAYLSRIKHDDHNAALLALGSFATPDAFANSLMRRVSNHFNIEQPTMEELFQ